MATVMHSFTCSNCDSARTCV